MDLRLLLFSVLTILPSYETSEPVRILLGTFRGVKMLTEKSPENEIQDLVPVRTFALDYLYAKREVYLYSNDSIVKYTLSENLTSASGPEPVVAVETMVTSLAVDWEAEDVYFITRQRSAVEAARLGGGGRRTLVTREDSPQWHSIAVDPYIGKLFWLSPDVLVLSDRTGHGLQEVAVQMKVHDLALDHDQLLVYVAGVGELGTTAVARYTYMGKKAGKTLALGHQGSTVFGLGVIANTLYWESNHEGENLYKSKFPESSGGTDANVTQVEELYYIVHDLKIYHPDLQKNSKKVSDVIR